MKLICFDVDGTLIDLEPNVWSVLNREYNFQTQDSVLFRKYKEGEITYQEWVDKDFEHYIRNGLNKKILKAIFEEYKPFNDVRETLDILSQKYRMSVLSGSIDFLLVVHGIYEFFEHILINKVVFNRDDIIRVESTPYDLDRKVKGMEYLLQLTHNKMEDCFYIGDGDNDIPLSKFMKNNGGTFIAFNPKSEELIKNAKYVINSGDIRDVSKYIT